MTSSWQSCGRLTKGPTSTVPDDDLVPNNCMKGRRFPNSVVGKYCPTFRRSSKTTFVTEGAFSIDCSNILGSSPIQALRYSDKPESISVNHIPDFSYRK